tara:strand:+ start:367 stop:633 length:267 start_codon:yes stop_codon:yes gene_type:complete
LLSPRGLGYWGTWGTGGLSFDNSNIVSPDNGCLSQFTIPQHRLIFLHLDCSAVLQKDITNPITIPVKASSPVSVKEIQLIYMYMLFYI